MSSFVEDRRPLASVMQNYHQLDVDLTASQSSLNIPEDNGRKYRAESTGVFGINLRILFTVVSVVFFILALVLFIGTIVAYYNRPSNEHGGGGSGTAKPPVLRPDASTSDAGSTPKQDSGFETEKWSVTKLNDQSTKPGELVFLEDFLTFNTTSWNHFSGDSDNHFYFHVDNRTNSFVRDGVLYLKPTYTSDRFGDAYVENGTLLLGVIPSEKCANEAKALCWKGSSSIVHPIMAPMIMSKSFFKFKYGKLLIRAKMPSGDWIEPIISLQPDLSAYGEDLRSGQIHFVDTRGNRKLFNVDGVNVGSEQTCPDIRFGTKENKKISFYCLNTDTDKGYDTDFHDYELEWTPSSITLRIDGEGVVAAPYPRPSMYKLWSKGFRVANPWANAENRVVAPFDKNFYLVIGISIGGVNGFFSEDYENKAYPKPWNNTDVQNAAKAFWDARKLWEPTWVGDQSALQIDSIRLYALNETVSD